MREYLRQELSQMIPITFKTNNSRAKAKQKEAMNIGLHIYLLNKLIIPKVKKTVNVVGKRLNRLSIYQSKLVIDEIVNSNKENKETYTKFPFGTKGIEMVVIIFPLGTKGLNIDGFCLH